MNDVTKPVSTLLFILFLFVLTISAKITAGELYPVAKEAPISGKQTSLSNLSLDELSNAGIWRRPGRLCIISDWTLCRRDAKP